jgi:hypothetical protein
MEQYLICEKRGNLPRIHVKICECRCPDTRSCPAFKAYLEARSTEESVADRHVPSPPHESPALAAP